MLLAHTHTHKGKEEEEMHNATSIARSLFSTALMHDCWEFWVYIVGSYPRYVPCVRTEPGNTKVRMSANNDRIGQ